MKNKLLITLCILCAILLFTPITAWAMTDTPEEEPEEPKEEEPVTEIVPPKTGVSTTNSENEGILFLLSLCMVVVPIKKIKVN